MFFDNISVTFVAGIADINCALGQPAVASTNTSTAHLVNDGNPATRWGSSYANNQWIYIDRGQSRDIHRVVLKWETAYASGYRLEVSNDASNWTQILTMSNGQSCVEDLGNLTGSGRYVHLYCVQASRVGEFPGGNGKPAVSSHLASPMNFTNPMWQQFLDLPSLQAGLSRRRASSYDHSGGNRDWISVAGHSTREIFRLSEMAGYICRIWFTIKSRDDYFLENLKFQFAFDDVVTVETVPFDRAVQNCLAVVSMSLT